MRTLIATMALFAATVAIPVWGATPAHPGMLNYVEGQANINGQAVTNKSVGNADVEQGQVIETGKGRAEILLTPGVFLRLGNNSALRMENSGLADTTVALIKGEALVEATDLHKANHIQIVNQSFTTTLEKNGLYFFRADQPMVEVYDGQAAVEDGGNRQELKKGKEVQSADLKTVKFDTKQGDDLYRWSDLRSEYLSEASVSSAQTYLVDGGGWYGGGWYWNPGYGYYSYLPGDGFLWSPFGWGFFSPRAYYSYAPGFRSGYYHGAGVGRAAPVNRGAFVGGGRPLSSGFAGNRAFAGGAHASGIGGGGGFHGGGGGGGGRR
jgi:hypothetical protein